MCHADDSSVFLKERNLPSLNITATEECWKNETFTISNSKLKFQNSVQLGSIKFLGIFDDPSFYLGFHVGELGWKLNKKCSSMIKK